MAHQKQTISSRIFLSRARPCYELNTIKNKLLIESWHLYSTISKRFLNFCWQVCKVFVNKKTTHRTLLQVFFLTENSVVLYIIAIFFWFLIQLLCENDKIRFNFCLQEVAWYLQKWYLKLPDDLIIFMTVWFNKYCIDG